LLAIDYHRRRICYSIRLSTASREPSFQNQITDPANGVSNQNFNARGIAVSGNVGYNHNFGTWFIEPSAGITWSRLQVDPINVAGTLFLDTGLTLPGTAAIDDIESTLGRLSLRVGTTLSTGNLILQPFVTASVFHEFSGDVTTRFRTCLAALAGQPCGTTLDLDGLQTTSRVGTYGQFALGIAGQLANTGWLGYTRVDFRTGANIDGISVNGGLRYQFTPEQIAAVVGKGPVYKAPPAPVPVAESQFTLGFDVSSIRARRR
jgi:outer membrane autotransporter protein